MSLILDALNKADRERGGQEPVPQLQTYHAAPKTSQNPLPAWVYILIGALIVTVILCAVLLLRFWGDDALGSQQEAKPQPQANSARQPFGPSQPQAQRPDDIAPIEGVASLYAGVKKPSGKTSEPVEPAVASLYADVVAEDESKGDQQVPSERAVSNRSGAETSPPKRSEPLVSDEELQQLWQSAKQQTQTPRVSDPAVKRYANLPYLHQLPESFQERIPTLMYQNHIYTQKASAVILNGNTYKKGDEVSADLKVVAITEEDLVLSYLDKPFKLAALSSWVQMR